MTSSQARLKRWDRDSDQRPRSKNSGSKKQLKASILSQTTEMEIPSEEGEDKAKKEKNLAESKQIDFAGRSMLRQ